MPRKVNRKRVSEEAQKSKNFQAAMELIKDKEFLFDTIMAAMIDFITIQDLDLRIVYQSKSVTDLFGEHLGEYCYKIYERRDEICPDCPVIKTWETGKPCTALRVGATLEGPVRFENIAMLLKNREGEIVAGLESIRRVEEREKALDELRKKTMELDAVNQQLKASEQQLRAANQQLIAAQKQLQDKISEMERFHKLTIDREEKILELKARIKELEAQLKTPKSKD